HRHVLSDRHPLDEPLVQAVFGQVGEAAAERRPRRVRPERPPVDPEPPAIEWVDPEDAARDLRAPGADEAGEADDLAATELEADVREDAGARESLGAEDDVADLRLLLREERVERPAD